MSGKSNCDKFGVYYDKFGKHYDKFGKHLIGELWQIW